MKHTESGFTIVQALLTATVVGMLMVAMGKPITQTFSLFRNNSIGDHANQVGNAVDTYITTYYKELNNQVIATNTGGNPASFDIPGVANDFAPTIPELIALNILPANFSSANPTGANYVASINILPNTCTVIEQCNVLWKVYLNQPLRNSSGSFDGPGAGQVALRIGNRAGYSDLNNPGFISANGWSEVNPMGNVAGILMLRATFNSSQLAALDRRDGSLPRTGPINMNGNNIANAQNISASGILQLGNSGGQIQGAGGVLTANQPVATPGVRFQPGVGGNVADGQACTTVGVAQANSDGKLWTCQNVSGSLRWKAPSDGQSGVPKTANFLQQYAGRSGSFCEYSMWSYVICTYYSITASGINIYNGATGYSQTISYASSSATYTLNPGVNPYVLTTINLTPAGITYQSAGTGCLTISPSYGYYGFGNGAMMYITPDMLDAGITSMSGQTITYEANTVRCALNGPFSPTYNGGSSE